MADHIDLETDGEGRLSKYLASRARGGSPLSNYGKVVGVDGVLSFYSFILGGRKRRFFASFFDKILIKKGAI